MGNYKLISFDMFQTLADVRTQKENVMRRIFSRGYTEEKGNRFWEDADRYVYAYFHRLTESEEFVSVAAVFTECYRTLFPHYGITLDPRIGAGILAEAHTRAALYPESLDFFAAVKKKYKTCLMSDTDNNMLGGLLDLFSFDSVYTSENYKAYKFSTKGTLFKAAISDFRIKPREMLHIGDGYNDVAGAKAAGADAVWINRNGRIWRHEVKPDYIASDLREINL